MNDAHLRRPPMTFREIPFGSDDFRKECELRHEVLRMPLGLSLYDEDIDRERHAMHFGLFDEGGDLVACVIAVPLSTTHAKIRQMAVRGDHQGKGFGRWLIRCLEDHLVCRGLTHVSMHARTTAVGFYERLGYERVGHEFTELGIPHIKMEKRLTSRMQRASQ